MSRITLRLVEKPDKKGEGDSSKIKAKLSGEIIEVLRQALVRGVNIMSMRRC